MSTLQQQQQQQQHTAGRRRRRRCLGPFRRVRPPSFAVIHHSTNVLSFTVTHHPRARRAFDTNRPCTPAPHQPLQLITSTNQPINQPASPSISNNSTPLFTLCSVRTCTETKTRF